MMCSESMKVVSRGKREQLGVCVKFSSSLWIMHALPSVSFFILTQTHVHTHTHTHTHTLTLTRTHTHTHTQNAFNAPFRSSPVQASEDMTFPTPKTSVRVNHEWEHALSLFMRVCV